MTEGIFHRSRGTRKRPRVCRWKNILLVVSAALVVFSIQLHAWQKLHSNGNATDVGQRLQRLLDQFNPTKTLLPALPQGRDGRFPSVEERVQVYMGYWFHPPCNPRDRFVFTYNATTNPASVILRVNVSTRTDGKTEEPAVLHFNTEGRTFFAQIVDFEDCQRRFEALHHSRRIRNECLDVQQSIPLNLLWSKSQQQHHPPIFLRITDGTRLQRVPSLHHVRRAITDEERHSLFVNNTKKCYGRIHEGQKRLPSLPEIIMNLNSPRYFGPQLQHVAQRDIPWEEKKDMAVFRGALTGGPSTAAGDATERDKCLNNPRCALVLRHANSTLINAKLTSVAERLPTDTVDGIQLVHAKGMHMRDLLQYKALIFLPGNDISSGVFWGLLSRSVVLMPPPTMTSWAMEELLRPFEHYVPLDADLGDVEERMQWIKDHDSEAKQIAHRGSLWIQDLVFHPQALADNRAIYNDMLGRYAAHFEPEES